MKELFLRKATVAVGSTSIGSNLVELASSGVKFDGFRVAFEIDKTSESSPNPAKISIYNLNAASRAALEAHWSEQHPDLPILVVMLSIGYAGIGDGDPIVSQIYAGDVRRTITNRQGPDIVTVIEAGDAEVALRNTHIEQSFGAFTSPAQVIKALVGKLNLSVGTISAAVGDFFQHGFSLSGNVADQLDVITAKLGLEWHVTDGELNIVAPDEAIPGQAILLNKNTGLIGFPSKTQEGIIDFKALANPEIKPGRLITLESATISGTFRVRTAKYRGDTHGPEWSVAVEAV